MAPQKTYDTKPKRPKPGPKPKPLDQRKYTVTKPVLRVERSYSNDKRRDVLAYLYNERVYDPCSSMQVRQGMTRHPADQYREVSYREASIYFKIPKSTITKWWAQRERILGGKLPPNKQIPTSVEKTPPATSLEDCSLQPDSPLVGNAPLASSVEDGSLQPSPLVDAAPLATSIEDSSLQASPLVGATSPAASIEDSSLQPSPLVGVTSPAAPIEDSSLQDSPLVGAIDSEANLA
ncbi:hypothetical protein SEPCBS57363_004430 [Sporothrix epigloea]|uniref:Uncharacterized protein n=1 Tax=Sporothrix epigloea TaxID=1892477 RepID=A0ABP0DUX3_9PEZI